MSPGLLVSTAQEQHDRQPWCSQDWFQHVDLLLGRHETRLRRLEGFAPWRSVKRSVRPWGTYNWVNPSGGIDSRPSTADNGFICSVRPCTNQWKIDQAVWTDNLNNPGIGSSTLGRGFQEWNRTPASDSDSQSEGLHN
ncbi:hypothetical protein PCANC_12978 [Puccinia coronata f. sp. avenae]|uniref:Uncharacterized protein n=1 Tax=Puccinia coronata f. sp. avenae TaxID=200324 RepID=A0A2N5SMQ8_9BASI|nr:hypothetical protein PCANC_12978 [Puccinia coronata f. sp. avenae]PLW39252.1 hypothetical protein PCASD_05347 [Puccinia coronata f. sp. avenae]